MCSTWALWGAGGGGVFIMLCMSSVITTQSTGSYCTIALLLYFSPMGAARAYSAPQGQQRGTPTETQQLSSRSNEKWSETAKHRLKKKEVPMPVVTFSNLSFNFKTRAAQVVSISLCPEENRRSAIHSILHLHPSLMNRFGNMTFKRENVLSLCLMKDWEELLLSVCHNLITVW